MNGEITGIRYADLERMSFDDVEVENRWLDAWLEARYLQSKKKRGRER